MSEKLRIVRIPTEEDCVILKTVTALDDEAWLLTKRRFKHPYPPSNQQAPDYQRFLQLRKQHQREQLKKLNMGIWDVKTFGTIAFVGFAELDPIKDKNNSANLSCEIADGYQGLGYATTALQAIMKYGNDNLGVQTYKAKITESNVAGQNLADKLGFEFIEQMYSRLFYELKMPQVDTASQVRAA